MPASRKKGIGDDLILPISRQATHIPDHRPNKLEGKISLYDAVMSTFAVMHLKYPSLLQFDKDKLEPEIRANLKSGSQDTERRIPLCSLLSVVHISRKRRKSGSFITPSNHRKQEIGEV